MGVFRSIISPAGAQPGRFLSVLLVMSLCLGGLGACSVKSAYNNMDTYLLLFLRDYISLNAHQETAFRQQLKGALSWHRSTQLPLYIDSLKQLIMIIREDRIAAEVDTLFTDFQGYSETLLQYFTPHLVDLFHSSTPEQKAGFIKKLDQGIEERRKNIRIPPAELRKLKAGETKKLFSRWLGSLNTQQQEAIAAWSGRLELVDSWELAEQGQWRDELDRLLQSDKSQDEYIIAIKEIATSIAAQKPGEIKQKEDFNIKLTKQLIIQIMNSLTPEQKNTLIRKLSDLLKDLEQV